MDVSQSTYSNTEGITGTPMSNPARGLHDRGSTGNYVRNIWSNYMKGGAPTQVNYKLLSLDEVVKRYRPQKSEPKAGPKVEVAKSLGILAESASDRLRSLDLLLRNRLRHFRVSTI